MRRTFYPIALDADTWTLRVPPGSDWGHAWLRSVSIGAALDCLGPVGHGYSVPATTRNLLCLGEGDAAWALLPVIAQADASRLAVTLAMESVSARDLIPAPRLPTVVEYHTAIRLPRSIRRASDSSLADGVGQFLPELLPWADAVLAAGSVEFYNGLAATIRSVRYELSRGFAQVLYPAAFLCGVGACQACVADLAAGRRRICQRGPVLDLADVVT